MSLGKGTTLSVATKHNICTLQATLSTQRAFQQPVRASHGFTRPLPSLLTVIGMAASFWLLAKAMQTLPVGTTYAVWTGMGTIGTVLLGIVLFQDAVNAPRLLCLGLILAGIIGLKVFSP